MSTPSDAASSEKNTGNTGKFRLSASDILLTYPQCDASKEELERHLRNVFKDFTAAAICREVHQDGHPHLHAIVHLSKRCNLHSSRTLDFHDGRGRIFHGNYQPARNSNASLNYVEKGGDVLYCGGSMEDVRRSFQNRLAPKEAGKKRINECFQQLLSGKTVAQILRNEELQGCMIMHRKNLEAAVAVITTEEALKRHLKFETASGPDGSPSQAIAAWLNQNLNQVRPFGAQQMLLTGPTGIGKSHLLKTLEPALRIFYLNMNEDWMDGYDDDLYDLIAIEEFHSQKTLQFMNQLLDGQPMPLKIRNGNGGKLKRKNLPIIITSNFGLNELYPKVDQMRKATFVRRVQEVYAPDRLEITIKLIPRDQIDVIIPGAAATPPEAQPVQEAQPVLDVPERPFNRWRSRVIEVNEEDETECLDGSELV